MQPGSDERPAGRGLALGELVLVVREDQVDAARVDVERGTEVGHAHGRALDVPAGSPGADRGVPRRLTRLRSLPEREVADVSLAVLVRLDALADAELLGIEPGEPAVRRPRVDAEGDRAVLRPVGVARVKPR